MINRIYEIIDKEGNLANTPKGMEDAFIPFYKDLLGSDIMVREHVKSDVVKRGRLVSNTQGEGLSAPITDFEIKNALWSIGSEKASGLDGFSSKFYKDNWAIIREDISEAVRNFFENGKF